jgi:hypothetical protein
MGGMGECLAPWNGRIRIVNLEEKHRLTDLGSAVAGRG